ncbi:MAG: 2,3-bisphosphoglycerate-independent phosphoglycerate mutase [Bacteroides sp.]|nr:2,3-bisphosphoglycerate-independent phosphoglycerate mutase [Bacteroides sp.]
MSNKALLIILDGYGIGDHGKDDAIFNTPTPYIDSLVAEYPHSQLQASGENVGLPDGQMGNSEVGHLNIGAGRVVYQDLVKINRAIADGSFAENPEIKAAFSYARDHNVPVHFMGLTSSGGVHSSLIHLYALCDTAKAYNLSKVYLHCFMDGRDTDPKSGAGFLREVKEHCAKSAGTIASVIGRYYAMDRDHRWERLKEAYNLLVYGEGKQTDDVIKAVEESYAEGVTDEFLKPIVNDNVDGRIGAGHVVIFFNYRNDRAKELTTVLTQHSEAGMNPIPDLQYYCMTPYDDSFKDVHVIFTKSDVPDTLAEYLSGKDKKQLHIAETEKYAHVTFFFNGGREAPFEGEDRILVPSPKVATYDLQPEMSAPEVTEKLVEAIDSEKYDFIVVNFANGDMVGHTGVYPAIQKAVGCLDKCVEKVVEAAKSHGYGTIIIADHGNADHAINEDGTPNTAHSLNPVPFIYVGNKDAKVKNGRLADVAPSLLHIMGLPKPADMTGEDLIED